MSRSRSSSILLFVLAFALVLVGMASVRLMRSRAPRSTTQRVAATSSAPALTSASFLYGDALAGLGADWTFVRQTELDGGSAAQVEGVSSTRQSVIKAIQSGATLVLEEANIRDQAKLDRSLKSTAVKPLTIAGRAGYLVPVISIAGGNGFFLMGSSTTLLVQDADSASWPQTLSSEELSYIASVRVP